jgi:translation elongation factor EF-Ts
VNLSKASGKQISAQYATADNTASAGTDYIATEGLLTFQLGETQKVVAVQVNSDTFFEADETFFINLTNPVEPMLKAWAQLLTTIHSS